MLGRDHHLPKYNKRTPILAEDLNKVRTEVKRLGQVKAASPLSVASNATGIHLALTGGLGGFWAEITAVDHSNGRC